MTPPVQGFRLFVAAGAPREEATFVVHDDKSVGLDGVQVTFDDERVVCDAGIAVVATLALRLGIEAVGGIWCACVATGLGPANAGAT